MLYDTPEKRMRDLRRAILLEKDYAEAATEQVYCSSVPEGHAVMRWARDLGEYNYYMLRYDGIRGPNCGTSGEAMAQGMEWRIS